MVRLRPNALFGALEENRRAGRRTSTRPQGVFRDSRARRHRSSRTIGLLNVYRKLAAPALGLLAACSLIAVARAQVPSPLPGVSAAPSQMPSPAPTPTIAILPPDAAPQILWWRLSST